MPLEPDCEPVTATEAATALQRPATTIRVWIHRYGVVRLNPHGRRTAFYDLRDLRVIERELYHRHDVPPTPEARAAIRLACPLRDAERATPAA